MLHEAQSTKYGSGGHLLIIMMVLSCNLQAQDASLVRKVGGAMVAAAAGAASYTWYAVRGNQRASELERELEKQKEQVVRAETSIAEFHRVFDIVKHLYDTRDADRPSEKAQSFREALQLLFHLDRRKIDPFVGGGLYGAGLASAFSSLFATARECATTPLAEVESAAIGEELEFFFSRAQGQYVGNSINPLCTILVQYVHQTKEGAIRTAIAELNKATGENYEI